MNQPAIELSQLRDLNTSVRLNHDAVANAIRHEEVTTDNAPNTTSLSRGIVGVPTTTSKLRGRLRFSFAHDLEVHNPHSETRAPDSGLVRDFYALERTFLAYNRTSNTLSSYAILVTQLFVLHEGHRRLGMACGIFMLCGGIVLELIGLTRYLRQSRELLLRDHGTGVGRVVVPNLYMGACGVIVGVVCGGLFIVLLCTSE